MGSDAKREHGDQQQHGADLCPAHQPGRAVTHSAALLDLIGPFRYEGLFGSLKGHSYPNAPWIHAEKFSFKPSRNVEFGFSRVVIFAGKGPCAAHLRLVLAQLHQLQQCEPGGETGQK